jgi:tryptophan synthase alpha chain
MVNRYQTRFSQLRKEQRKAFIPFTVLGWPDPDTCLSTIKTMIERGVSALELGIAFSDPVADGPLIQQAAAETIESGFSLNDAFSMLEKVRRIDAEIPIGLLVYYNSILSRGENQFFGQAKKCGVDGILIADATPDVVHEQIATNDLAHICLVSPLTDSERLKEILPAASGFLYVLSRLGITGIEERYDRELKSLIERLKHNSQLPLCVGFGISNPAQATSMFELGADGVVSGSRIIQIVREAVDLKRELGDYLGQMMHACDWRNDTSICRSNHQPLIKETSSC